MLKELNTEITLLKNKREREPESKPQSNLLNLPNLSNESNSTIVLTDLEKIDRRKKKAIEDSKVSPGVDCKDIPKFKSPNFKVFRNAEASNSQSQNQN